MKTSFQVFHLRPLMLVACCHLVLLPLSISAAFCANTSCSSIKTYTVSSSGHDDQGCTSNQPTTPCKTLDYLLARIQSCAVVTLSSPQTLTRGLKLSSSHDMTIEGNKTMPLPVPIVCLNESGILFESSWCIHLDNLYFMTCSMKQVYPNTDIYPLVDYAGLYFYQGSDIEISGCSFNNGTGTGVIMYDTIGNVQLKNTNFTGNKPVLSSVSTNLTSGGLIIKRQSILGEATYTIDTCYFTENENIVTFGDKSGLGGGLHFHFGAQRSNTSVRLISSHFISNHAIQGGGVQVNQSGASSFVSMSVSSDFHFNHASHEGGGMWLQLNMASLCSCVLELTRSTFANNSGMWGGGLSVFSGNDKGNVIIQAAHSVWTGNNAKTGGLGVGMNFEHKWFNPPNSNLSTFAITASFVDCYFLYNTNKGFFDNLNAAGAVQVGETKLELTDSHFWFNTGSALHLRDFSYASFAGSTFFRSNDGISGAALYVDASSAIALIDGVSLFFHLNHALIEGGAIYMERSSRGVCVFENLISDLLQSSGTFNVSFVNNTAGAEKESIFVGSPSCCFGDSSNTSILLFDSKIFAYEPPLRSQVVSFANNITLYTISDPRNGPGDYVEVMLGEYFYLVPTVIDVFNNSVSLPGNLQLLARQRRKTHTTETLKLIGPSFVSMDNFTKNNPLYITGPKNVNGYKFDNLLLYFIYKKSGWVYNGDVSVEIKLVECKTGFVYNNTLKQCKCNERDSLTCPSPTRSYACVRYGYWFGDYEHTDGKPLPCPGQNCHYVDGVCPRSDSCPASPSFCRLKGTDGQCWDGRSGILCSGCLQNYSFTFGGLRCVPSSTCSPGNTAWILLGIIFCWIFFVVLVLVVLSLNLSLGLGFMYGIVYYFSVLNVFTDTTVTDPFLQIIINIGIAITQLSPRFFGDVPICFAESWNLNLHHYMFHNATPFFVIGMISIIILVSRCCRLPKRISLAENSPIHAICLLVLLSYTSLVYASFQMLKSLKIKGELRVYVDPEIRYFHMQHLPYALVALLSECFVALPICLFLLFAPCLSRKVNFVKLRLKPILDDFQACYRPSSRWFAGFYFLARQLVFLANTNESLPQNNSILHYTNALILIVHSFFQPYNLKWLNLLDSLLLLDIFLLSFFNLEWNSSFMHRAVPYLLILPPFIYLISVVLLIVSKRIILSVWFQRALTKFKRSRSVNTELPSAIPTPTSTSVGMDDSTAEPESKSKLFGGSGFFKDYGEREPLLCENDSVRPINRSHTYTTSSLRMPSHTMAHKASTN